MIKIGSVGIIRSSDFSIMFIEPGETFIVIDCKQHDNDEIDALTYFVKSTKDCSINWLYEEDIEVLCEPDSRC